MVMPNIGAFIAWRTLRGDFTIGCALRVVAVLVATVGFLWFAFNISTDALAAVIDGNAQIVDDPETILRVGISVWERYTGPYTDEMRPFVDQMMNNRICVRVVPSRLRSWDHRKLGMPAMPIGGSTAQYL